MQAINNVYLIVLLFKLRTTYAFLNKIVIILFTTLFTNSQTYQLIMMVNRERNYLVQALKNVIVNAHVITFINQLMTCTINVWTIVKI